VGETTLDICGRCEGTFFDAGEMLSAFGLEADPSTWDRPETGGVTKESTLKCPRCQIVMHAQDVRHNDKHVEVDRCGKCRGVWLDKKEIDTILAIGHALAPVLAAERAKAHAELQKLENDGVDFKKSPIRTFLKNPFVVAALVVLTGLLIVGIYIAT